MLQRKREELERERKSHKQEEIKVLRDEAVDAELLLQKQLTRLERRVKEIEAELAHASEEQVCLNCLGGMLLCQSQPYVKSI